MHRGEGQEHNAAPRAPAPTAIPSSSSPNHTTAFSRHGRLLRLGSAPCGCWVAMGCAPVVATSLGVFPPRAAVQLLLFLFCSYKSQSTGAVRTRAVGRSLCPGGPGVSGWGQQHIWSQLWALPLREAGGVSPGLQLHIRVHAWKLLVGRVDGRSRAKPLRETAVLVCAECAIAQQSVG